MHPPPFKLATPIDAAAAWARPEPAHAAGACCDGADATAARSDAPLLHARVRLGELDLHLHCSIIGTCLGTAELRKLMARFLFVRDSSDLEIHHEAVRLAGQGGPVTKALNKTLDQRHAAAVERYGRARDDAALTALWDEALRQGDIPGAYWALLTHRHVTPALRQRAFGDVHMLSHLVGAANRADIRRLVALEQDNAAGRERVERLQARAQELVEERDRTVAQLQRDLAEAQARAASAAQAAPDGDAQAELEQAAARVALQTERRERAELAAGVAAEEASRLRLELAHLQRHVRTLMRELEAAETQLREIDPGTATRTLERQLRGRRVFYVGGRPSSTPAIRDLVLRHGGEFLHHDGGLEDRKGLLASGVGWAHLVVFPVDCVDHDSAGNLKRLCGRQGTSYVPLRSASVASLAAALSRPPDDDHDDDR